MVRQRVTVRRDHTLHANGGLKSKITQPIITDTATNKIYADMITDNLSKSDNTAKEAENSIEVRGDSKTIRMLHKRLL